jgi:methyltransferase (TIGR00027 family)
VKQDHSSITAQKVAMLRAAHQILDHPKVFDDPIALRIVGTQRVSDIHLQKRQFKTRLSSYLRAIVVARSRLVEDELAAAIKRGVCQYVILGAGLDTFAYRHPYSDKGLSVFEVDYPATQAWKREQLKTAGISIPDSLTFVPIDFEIQTLARRLQEAGFREDVPSFFSWLGVTMYLNRKTVMATLKQIISSTPSGSAIVFDYAVPPSSQSFFRRLVFRLLAMRMAMVSEPWKGFFDPRQLIIDLKAIGFSQVDDMGTEDINTRFFSNRKDRLMVGGFGHLMNAQH